MLLSTTTDVGAFNSAKVAENPSPLKPAELFSEPATRKAAAVTPKVGLDEIYSSTLFPPISTM